MVCLKAYDKTSNMRRTQLVVNLHWLLIDLRIDFKSNFLTVFIEIICYFLIETKTLIKKLSFGSLRNRVHVCIYTAWVGRRDLPLQGLSCCLVKHFNISGSEVDTGSTCIKSTGIVICRVPRGEEVGVATVGVGIAVVCSVVVYAQVVSATKGWSVTGTCVYGVTVVT